MRRRAVLAIVVSAGLLFGQSPAPVGYSLETVAGGDFVGDDGPATAALLAQAEGLAADTKGNWYIADAGNHRVRKVSPWGVITTVAGNGRPGFSGDGGPAANAQLRTPYGLAADRAGNLFIADLGNARIRKVGPDGMITTVAGGGTTPAVDGVVATSAALSRPRNLTVDYYNAVYFSDFGSHRVFRLTESGTLATIAGAGVPGLDGDGGPAIKAKLNSPAGLAVDASGAVFISDSQNARVRKVWRGVISTLGTELGGAPIPVTTPAGLALDPDGSLFIADLGGNQILRVTPGLVSTPVPIPARDVAVDVQGNLYACAGPFVYKRPRFGDATIVAGATASSYVGDGTAANRARFADPNAVARDAVGNLYVADTGNHRIRKITVDGAVLTIAGNGLRGFAGDGGPAIAAQLDTPSGVVVDPAGNVYIADTLNHRIRKVDPTGIITTIAGTGKRGWSAAGLPAAQSNIDSPTHLAVDRSGNLFVSETGAHSVRRIGADGLLGTVAGVGSRGFSGDGGPGASAMLDSPQGIAVDAAGNVFLADTGNRRIRRVAAPNSYGPSLITTVPDAFAALWRGAKGIAVSGDGRIFVSDAEDARIFRIDGPGRITIVAGTGVPSFTSDSGPALQEGLNAPAGLIFEPTGALILADSANGRIRRIRPVQETTVTPPVSPSSAVAVVNGASLRSTSVIAPGQIVSLFGTALGPAQSASASIPAFELGGAQVLFNGRLAPLFYVSATQLNLQVPYSVAASASVDIQVLTGGIVRARTNVRVVDAAPALFTVTGGTGQAAALNADGTYNSESNPAARGSVVVLFATGEGPTNPPAVDGALAAPPLPAPVLPVAVKVAGYAAELLYAGSAPGYAGLMQLNVRIPAGFLPPGNQSVVLSVGNAVSQPGVTIWLK